MLWGVWVAVILQIYLNIEISRYTLATGESIFTGLCRVSGIMAPLFIFLMVTSWIIPGWAISAGRALKFLIVGARNYGSAIFWSFVCYGFIIYFAILFQFNWTWRRALNLIMAISFLILIFALSAIPSNEAWEEALWGFGQVGTIEEEYGVAEFLTIVIYAGQGGMSNSFISIMLREGGAGIAKYFVFVNNPLRIELVQDLSKMSYTSNADLLNKKLDISKVNRIGGYIYTETKYNQRKFRYWFLLTSLVHIFFSIFYIAGTLIATAIAISLFYFDQIPTNNITYPIQVATILESLYNSNWKNVFLVSYFLVQFTTQTFVIDYCAKIFADIIFTNWRVAQFAPNVSWIFLYMFIVWLMTCMGMTIHQQVTQTIQYPAIVRSTVMSGISVAILAPLVLYVNFRFLPTSAKPGIDSILAISALTLIYVAFFGIQIFGENWYAVFIAYIILSILCIIAFIYHKLWKIENLKKWVPNIFSIFFLRNLSVLIKYYNCFLE
eukprot:TRINITY_DN2636_c1_g3_i1.p1 TRINITY_DN2636_c1_g3~~TRINITY_DN2636_c1_g3_i1.p1  ORF type:complete len:495 (-),score=165.00 TRINITY_DN2636_c1_g3_i1:19-1503(-)